MNLNKHIDEVAKKLPASKGQVQYQYELSSETEVITSKTFLDSRLTLYFSLYAY